MELILEQLLELQNITIESSFLTKNYVNQLNYLPLFTKLIANSFAISPSPKYQYSKDKGKNNFINF